MRKRINEKRTGHHRGNPIVCRRWLLEGNDYSGEDDADDGPVLGEWGVDVRESESSHEDYDTFTTMHGHSPQKRIGGTVRAVIEVWEEGSRATNYDFPRTRSRAVPPILSKRAREN